MLRQIIRHYSQMLERGQKSDRIILLTGFLGAGKTTFMRSLLDTYQDKIGVIVNGRKKHDVKLLKRRYSNGGAVQWLYILCLYQR